MAQSGGVVMTCGDILAGGGLGISKTVSMGNKIDLQEAEYLEYLLKDSQTDVIFIYLESVMDGRSLVEQARGSPKPIMIYKSNTSPASAVAAASHTAALANDEQVLDAAFRQAGILRLHSMKELLASSKAFSMPPMRGNRLAVFSRSGGFGIVAADLASEFGFELPPFSQAVLETVRPYFRVNIMQENNPLDLGTVFDFDSFPVILESCIKEMHPDGMMLIFNYRRQDFVKSRQVFQKLANLSHLYQIPIALVVFTEMDEVHNLEKTLGFPVFGEVYDAMQGLAAWRSVNARINAQPVPFVGTERRPETERAAQILAACRSENRHPYLPEALEICQAYGLPVAPWAYVENAGQVVESAIEIGFPLVLKVVSGSISHKTEAGGVVLNIKDPSELEQAVQEMENRLSGLGLADQIKGFVLQKMLPAGRELILGGKRDPAFGPVLLVGLGGIFVEVLQDTALRLAPVTSEEARQMINELRGRQYLDEIRGQPAADLELLTNCLVCLSQIVTDLPDIQEIDINPMLLYPQGGAVVDARIGIRLDRFKGIN
jgi:acetyltransferase